MKKLAIGAVALIVLLVAVAAVLAMQLDKAVKYTVEEAGTEVTQVPVTLQKVNISVKSGKASLSGFSVNNPEGFSALPAISLGGISVEMDTASVLSDLIVVKDVTIEGPEVVYELVGKKTNIGTIQENIDRFISSISSDGGATEEEIAGEETASEEAGKKIIIESLHFREGMIIVKADAIEDGEKQIKLPEIHLKDIGTAENGFTANEIVAFLMKQVNEEAINAVKDEQIEGFKAKARTKINEKLKGWFGGDK